MDLSSPGIVQHVLAGIRHWLAILAELQKRGHALTDGEKDDVSFVIKETADLTGRGVEFVDKDDDNA